MKKEIPADSSVKRAIKVTFRSVYYMLLAKVYEVMPQQCPNCSADTKIIEFVTEQESIKKILNHLGEDTETPIMQTARAPPDEILFDDDIDKQFMRDNIPEIVLN